MAHGSDAGFYGSWQTPGMNNKRKHILSRTYAFQHQASFTYVSNKIYTNIVLRLSMQ